MTTKQSIKRAVEAELGPVSEIEYGTNRLTRLQELAGDCKVQGFVIANSVRYTFISTWGPKVLKDGCVAGVDHHNRIIEIFKA